MFIDLMFFIMPTEHTLIQNILWTIQPPPQKKRKEEKRKKNYLDSEGLLFGPDCVGEMKPVFAQ